MALTINDIDIVYALWLVNPQLNAVIKRGTPSDILASVRGGNVPTDTQLITATIGALVDDDSVLANGYTTSFDNAKYSVLWEQVTVDGVASVTNANPAPDELVTVTHGLSGAVAVAVWRDGALVDFVQTSGATFDFQTAITGAWDMLFIQHSDGQIMSASLVVT